MSHLVDESLRRWVTSHSSHSQPPDTILNVPLGSCTRTAWTSPSPWSPRQSPGPSISFSFGSSCSETDCPFHRPPPWCCPRSVSVFCKKVRWGHRRLAWWGLSGCSEVGCEWRDIAPRGGDRLFTWYPAVSEDQERSRFRQKDSYPGLQSGLFWEYSLPRQGYGNFRWCWPFPVWWIWKPVSPWSDQQHYLPPRSWGCWGSEIPRKEGSPCSPSIVAESFLPTSSGGSSHDRW